MRLFLLCLIATTAQAQSTTAYGNISPTTISVSVTNPTLGNDANLRRAEDSTCYTDSTTSNPNFSNEDCIHITQIALLGQATNGGGTNAKKTFFPLLIQSTAYGSGQRFLAGYSITCYGMSDCARDSTTVTYAGGPVSGDEGIGFTQVSYVQQQESLSRYTISSVGTPSSCNTTLTQNIVAARTAQAVTVASTTGCVVGDWIILNTQAANNSPNEEAVKITALGGGAISGVFHFNQTSGATVTPATVLVLNTTSQLGQDRVLVNLTASPYTTGTVASISGGGLTGSGTSWSASMEGGTALNPGCISLTNDDYTGSPFGSGSSALKSWYEVLGPVTSTGLGVYSTSVAGDASYRGNGVGNGAYTIRPCARMLTMEVSGSSLTGRVILNNNSFTWTAGDSVELAISPYPDVHGYIDYVKAWTPGGTYRDYRGVVNTGAQMFSSAFGVTSRMTTGGIGWNVAYSADLVNVGLAVNRSKLAGIYFGYVSAGDCYAIVWGGDLTRDCYGRSIGPTVDMTGADTYGLQECQGITHCLVFPPVAGTITPAVSAPGFAGASCTPPMISYASGFVYVCVATNTWQRAALSTF